MHACVEDAGVTWGLNRGLGCSGTAWVVAARNEDARMMPATATVGHSKLHTCAHLQRLLLVARAIFFIFSSSALPRMSLSRACHLVCVYVCACGACVRVMLFQVPLSTGLGTHYAWLWVGTPPQRQSVILDTGSFHTGFPCDPCTGERCAVPCHDSAAAGVADAVRGSWQRRRPRMGVKMRVLRLWR